MAILSIKTFNDSNFPINGLVKEFETLTDICEIKNNWQTIKQTSERCAPIVQRVKWASPGQDIKGMLEYFQVKVSQTDQMEIICEMAKDFEAGKIAGLLFMRYESAEKINDS